jgi:uncharacterized protein (DUF433 family)
MQTLTDIGTLIARTPGTCGGRPRIAGTRITVHYIVNEIRAGVTAEEILENKPHLTLAGIYAAIAYYWANQELLEAEFSAYDEECDGCKANRLRHRLEAEYLAGREGDRESERASSHRLGYIRCPAILDGTTIW